MVVNVDRFFSELVVKFVVEEEKKRKCVEKFGLNKLFVVEEIEG